MIGPEARDVIDGRDENISIGGASRSGSTLLAALLGKTKGFMAVGELRYIWSRGYLNNELCGYGPLS
jgi:hypothetical protein